MLKRYTFLTALLVSTLSAFGQVEEADFMRSTGKIYVVVAVIIAILIGIFIYLIRMDRKLTKLENQIDQDV